MLYIYESVYQLAFIAFIAEKVEYNLDHDLHLQRGNGPWVRKREREQKI